jgi:AbiU2
MTSSDQKLDELFEQELEVFRTEAEAGTQFFYGWLGVHATMSDHRPVFDLLNEASLFWATNLGALQQSAFMALGRIFNQDQRSKHNINRLLRIAQDNRQIFSREALGRRKERQSANASEWLPDYLKRAHQPTPAEFRRLKAHVKKWRRVYESNYRPIRHQLFAHKGISGSDQRAELFAKTNIREMQRLLMFLRQLHETLWELFYNGWKPVLRPQRYSAKHMRSRPSAGDRGNGVHEAILREAELFLLAAANVTKVAPPARGRPRKQRL